MKRSIVSPQAETGFTQRSHEPGTIYATLVIDGHGIIIKCSSAAAQLFHSPGTCLEGIAIWSLIGGIFPNNASCSYNARHMAHMCRGNDWRRGTAEHRGKPGIPLELAFSRLDVDGHTRFLLSLRVPEA